MDVKVLLYHLLLLMQILLMLPNGFAQSPYKIMLQKPVPYSGIERPYRENENGLEIRIGLFTPDETDNRTARAMMQGIKLAIDDANTELKKNQRDTNATTVRLIRRWMKNPWESGKEITQLIYQDHVDILIGAIDGQSTHLLEQIAVKARIPVISPIATNSSLTHIPIPWIFQLSPNDKAQAEVLYEQGIRAGNYRRIGLINSVNHDARMASKDMLSVMEKNNAHPLFQMTVPLDDTNINSVLKNIQSFSPDALIIFMLDLELIKLVSALQQSDIHVPLFMKWIPEFSIKEIQQYYSGDLCMVNPRLEENNVLIRQFVESFQNGFHENPTPVSYYSYDAVNVSVHAILNSVKNNTSLLDEIRNLSGYPGVSGVINWNNGGGNSSFPEITYCCSSK